MLQIYVCNSRADLKLAASEIDSFNITAFKEDFIYLDFQVKWSSILNNWVMYT